MIIVWGYGAIYQPQMPGVHLGTVFDWSAAGVTPPTPFRAISLTGTYLPNHTLTGN